MWFVLDKSLQECDFTSEQGKWNAIEHLLLEVALGHHAVAASPATIYWLRKAKFGARQTAVLASALTNSAEYLGIAAICPFSITVASDVSKVVKLNKGWRVPVSWLEKGVPRSCILGENQRDAELYMWAAKHFGAARRPGFGFDAQPACGGGANTPAAFAVEHRTGGRLVMCITDSDKHWPNAAQSSTSRGCSRLGMF